MIPATITIAEVEALAEKARAEVAKSQQCKTYAEILPAVLPIIEASKTGGFSSAAQFLIDEGIFHESKRRTVEQGLRRAMKSTN